MSSDGVELVKPSLKGKNEESSKLKASKFNFPSAPNSPRRELPINIHAKDAADDPVDYDDQDNDPSSHHSELNSDNKIQHKKIDIEFTNNFAMIRFVRMIICIQFIAIMLDHPSYQRTYLFNAFCANVASYVYKFYSRVFIDVLYIIELSYLSVIRSVQSSTGSGRRLSDVNLLDVSILGDQAYHAVRYYSDYFYGVVFFILGFCFTLFYWEFHDFTDRKDVSRWLLDFVADGWWRRGGVRLLWWISKAVLIVGAVALFLYVFSRQFSISSSLPNPTILGVSLVVGIVVVAGTWLIVYFFLRITESIFVRYVSQNVSYGSVLILKRVIKAKVEIGVSFLLALYMPVLSTFTQSLILVTDWNDYDASTFRRHENSYVPCYFLSFPPYRQKAASADSCSVSYSTEASTLTSYSQSFYDDQNILSCDSLLGITVYTLSFALFIFFITVYFWVFGSMIRSVSRDFKLSQRMNSVKSLQVVRDDEYKSYLSRFTLSERKWYEAKYECYFQSLVFGRMLHVVWRAMLDVIRYAVYVSYFLSNDLFYSNDNIFAVHS
jgi:hypothetical protein